MNDKIFELVAKGYEVSFKPNPGVRGTVLINLRKRTIRIMSQSTEWLDR